MICMLKLGDRGCLGESSSVSGRCCSCRLSLEYLRASAPELSSAARAAVEPTSDTAGLRSRVVQEVLLLTVAGHGWALLRLSECFSVDMRLFLQLLPWPATPGTVFPRKPLGWLLLDAPDEKPSSGSFRAKDSSSLLN